MTTIHKYALRVADYQEITMQGGAELLSVQMQGTVPCLWARVKVDMPPTIRGIVFAGTGSSLDPRAHRFIDTFQMGPLVFHVFEA